jgi:gamma-glutamylcyclotransferase (GGCT)/AIG2-like uncharacterized protein YtfP
MYPPGEMVFVYGTLRRSGSNHYRMEGAEFVADATVRGRLYRIDWYPGLHLDDAGDDVIGEIYQVSAEMLHRLDQYECDEYRRVMTQAQCGGDHRSQLSAWVWEWLGPVDANKHIRSGDWFSQPR